jgi:hypothetical protein
VVGQSRSDDEGAIGGRGSTTKETAVNLIIYTLATVASLADDVTINPTAEGMPGGDAMQKLVNWLGQGALVASLAAVAAGGGLFAWSRSSGSSRMAITGTALIGGGAVGALFTGLADTLVNTFHGLG